MKSIQIEEYKERKINEEEQGKEEKIKRINIKKSEEN